jgi:hypothetical protein
MSRSPRAKRCEGESSARLRVEFWPVERLIPSPRNARTHSDAQVAEIAGSIRSFGFNTQTNSATKPMSSQATYGCRCRGHQRSLDQDALEQRGS